MSQVMFGGERDDIEGAEMRALRLLLTREELLELDDSGELWRARRSCERRWEEDL
jgi:hypothetical protein